MDNEFFEFLETYWDDIAAFVAAFKEWLEAVIGKFTTEAE